MCEFKAILTTTETEKARLFRVTDRKVWIPRSVIKRLTKFAPDQNGEHECIIEVEEWFADKENL